MRVQAEQLKAPFTWYFLLALLVLQRPTWYMAECMTGKGFKRALFLICVVLVYN